MKTLITQRKNKTLRVQVDCSSSEKRTEPKHLRSCDINFIVDQYRKTGTFPSQAVRTPQYLDTTSIPDLATAMTMVHDAKQSFMELPAPIRKLMDNDPTKLEAFIGDPRNKSLLEDYGLTIKKDPKKEPGESSPAPAKPTGAAVAKKPKPEPQATEED